MRLPSAKFSYASPRKSQTVLVNFRVCRTLITQPNELVWSRGVEARANWPSPARRRAATAGNTKLGGRTVAKKKKAAKKGGKKKAKKKK
jgi:hypothetical protein